MKLPHLRRKPWVYRDSTHQWVCALAFANGGQIELSFPSWSMAFGIAQMYGADQ